jgi:hypothetical protein
MLTRCLILAFTFLIVFAQQKCFCASKSLRTTEAVQPTTVHKSCGMKACCCETPEPAAPLTPPLGAPCCCEVLAPVDMIPPAESWVLATFTNLFNLPADLFEPFAAITSTCPRESAEPPLNALLSGPALLAMLATLRC